MNNILSSVIEKFSQDHELLEACQLAMQELYPELLLRWSRIYGSRWAYLSGNRADSICLNPARIRITQEYGICIDNIELISKSELTDIIQSLKGCWAYESAHS